MSDQQGASSMPPRAMTVLGAVDSLGVTLMNEPLVCDPSKKQVLAGGEALSQEDMAKIRQNPFDNANNVTLSSTNDSILELSKAQHAFDTILDTTSVAMGRDPNKAKILSERLQKHIIQGTTPAIASVSDNKDSGDQVEASKEDIDRMEQELIYGLEDEATGTLVRAGFIGELQISDPIQPSELRHLKACAVVQATTKAPLLISVPGSQLNYVLEQIKACGGSLQRTVLTRMDLHGKNDISMLTKVLDQGLCVCFDSFLVSASIWDLDHEYPSRKEVVDMICTLLSKNPNYGQQLLLSCGISMKVQYTKYGGVGYLGVHDFLVPKLLQAGVTQSQVDVMLRDNPWRLLAWWTPPPPKEKPKEYMACSLCKRMFEPILGEYYTKYTFTYCDTKCLREHRKMGFKELK